MRLIERRKALLGMAHNVNAWTELTPSWTFGKMIDNYGTVYNSASAAITELFEIPNATIKRTGPAHDTSNVALYMFLHEYNGSAWLKRTELPNPGDSIKVSENCTRWRITFSYPVSTGKEMNATVIDSYFGAEYKEGN